LHQVFNQGGFPALIKCLVGSVSELAMGDDDGQVDFPSHPPSCYKATAYENQLTPSTKKA